MAGGAVGSVTIFGMISITGFVNKNFVTNFAGKIIGTFWDMFIEAFGIIKSSFITDGTFI